jgi:uncharacterized repeat protein (TIGR01451 family)
LSLKTIRFAKASKVSNSKANPLSVPIYSNGMNARSPMSNHFSFSICFCLLIVISLLAASSAVAQVQPVTGISAAYDDLSDTGDDYSTAGGGSGAFPSGTTYDLGFNVGSQNNLHIQGFETGTNVYDFIQLAQKINIMRVDSAVTGTHNIVFFEVETLSGTDLDLKPSLTDTMVESLRSDLANRGADNVFANQGDGNGNNNNIERIDYIFNAGFPFYNFTDQRGFLVMDRGGNDRFKIAVVLAVDSNDMPTAFSHPVSVLDSEWGSSGVTMHTLVMRGYTEEGDDILKPSADVSTQPLSGVFLSWDQFGLTTNDMVFGYSLAGNDVTTNGAYWTEYTNSAYFPTNTTVASAGGGLDLISGGAMFFDTVLEVAVGDRVWNDYNGDGVQDAVEPGLSNVLVHIYTSNDVLAATARSDSNGWFFAQGLGVGDFYLQFFPPDGYTLSPQYVSHDASLDSDPDALTGITETFSMASGETNLTIDAGLYLTPGDLRLSKAASATNLNVGDELVFTLSVTNVGTPNTDQIQVTDSLPAAFGFSGYGASTGTFNDTTGIWDLGYLATGASASISITGTVNGGSGGSWVTNNASITRMNRPDTNETDNTASAAFEVQSADLGVTKVTSTNSLEEGESTTFTVSVTNFGPHDVSGVEVDDLLPTGFEFTGWSAGQGSYDDASGVWTVGILSNGLGSSLEITADAGSGTGGTILTNVASIGASSHEDPNSANNAAEVDVLIYGADLEIQKSVYPLATMEGQDVVYSLVVTNPGPTNATGILVYDPLTNGLSYVSSTASQGSYTEGTGVWDVGAIPLYSSAVLRITASVVAGTMDTVITNRCLITATDWPDPHSENDEDTATLSISSLELSKTSDVTTSAHPGDVITYTIVASNAGSQTHAAIELLDPIPDGTAYVTSSLSVTRIPPSAAEVDYTSSTLFMVPAGVTSLTVEAWGGGAGGGRARANPSTAGGGAGGAYAKKVVAVTPLQTYTVTVGTGGIGGNSTGTDTQHGRPGNPSWFGTTNTIFAEGGARGLSDGRNKNVNGAPGLGSSAYSVGDEVYAGGDGSYGVCGASGYGGSGGGGAGSTGAGGDASGSSGGAGTSDGGGDGADGPGPSAVGLNGSEYGGGGSGGDANDRTDRNGGAGADGHLRISYASGGGIVGVPPDLASSWSLVPEQRLVATFEVVVDDPLDLLAITNTASVTSDYQSVRLYAQVIDPILHADLAITKTATESYLDETESMKYWLTVTNNSLLNSGTGIEVLDQLPAGFTLDSVSASQGTYDSTTGVWSVGALSTGEVATLEMDVTAAGGGGGIYWTNTATISAYDQFDPNTTNNTDQVVVLIQGADLSLSKSVDDPTPNETSQVVYTIRVENAGPSDVSSVEVMEPLTNGLTYVSDTTTQGSYNSGSGLWDVGDLNMGSSAVLTVTATVDVGTFGTVITNLSRISSVDLPDPNSGNDQDEETIIVSGLNVTKTSDVSSFASPGDTITYSIVVSNASSVLHTGIDVSDSLPTGTVYVTDSTWISGPGTNELAGDAPSLIATNRSLDAGESMTVTVEALVINPGASTQLLNTVSVTCDQQPAPVSAWVSDLVLHTDLGLTKTVDDAHPDEGDSVVYTIVVTNLGPTNASSVLVYEPLTNGLTYSSYTAGQGTYDSTTGVWSVGSLALGGSAQLEITATVDAGTSGSFITNRAQISGADRADLITDNNADTSVVQVVQVDIGIGKSANPAAPVESGLLIYTLSVTNLGPDTATGIEVTDVLPSTIDYFSYTAGQGTFDSTTGIWSVGALDSMESTSIAISCVVQTNTSGTSITNTASVSAVDQLDSDSGNDSDSVVVSPTEALLDLDKTADTAGPVWPGDTITYTLVVTNRSGVTQTNVTLTDPMPTGAVYVADSCFVTAPETVEETFGDRFGFRYYGNNDGTETWSGIWVDREDGDPTSGDVQIQFDNGVDETYTLFMRDDDEAIAREADLSAYRTAKIEFDYQRIGLEAGEYVVLEVSSSGHSGPWTELDRFSGAATDSDYIGCTNDLTDYISTNTVIRFRTPDGDMDDTDSIWVDNLFITGERRALITAAGGTPPNLTSGNLLEPNESLSATFQVWVANPALYSQIVNQGALTSDQMPSPQVDIAVTAVETCFTVEPTGLYANPTNVTSFTAHWTEVGGSFGYLLDVSTTPDFGATDYVAGYSNLSVAATEQVVTGLTSSVIYYFRVRAEWSPLCVSSNSQTASVTTLEVPSIWTGPESLHFGIVNVGSSSNLTLVVTNTTDATIDITAIDFTGTGYPTNFSVSPSTSSIPSSNSVTLTITFTPTLNETNDLTMTIYNTSAEHPELEVPVTGIGYDPDALAPELLAYLISDSASLTNEVTDRSLGEGSALATFTVYHPSGMTMAGASFNLVYPDDTLAFSNATFSSIEAETLDGKACQRLTATIPRIFPAELGDYAAQITVSSSNGIWLVDEAQFTSVASGGAAPELLDDFFRSNAQDDIGEGWFSYVTGPVSGNIQIKDRVLLLYGTGGTGGTNGRVSVARDMSSRYTPVLTNNSGTLTWAFNFYSVRDPQSGFAPGAYGGAFVLGSDSTDWVSGTGNGYAVRICSNEVALASFSGGLNLDSDLTTLGSVAALSTPTSAVAVQVDLDPDTGVWTLYVNELGDSGLSDFGNPLTDMASHEVMKVTNTFQLHRSLRYAGCYWNHGNAPVNTNTAAYFDDLYAPIILAASEPMDFASIDNDIMFPTALGTVLVNDEVVPPTVPDRLDVVWTNAAEFIITFDPMAADQDPGFPIPTVQRDVRGIGEYRVSSASVDVMTPSNRAKLGLPFPVVSTNGALANYGFEITPSGGDWILDANNQIQTRAADASLVYEGTNSLHQLTAGTASQTFEFRNASGITPRIVLSGYYLGGAASVTVDAYSTNDLVTPVATASVSPSSSTNWDSFSIAEQDLGDSTVEILKVTLKALGSDTYWDQLRFSVDIGTNRPSLRFRPGADNQGLYPQYLFAVDADYNRVGDRLGGTTKFFYTPFDLTPPTPVQMPAGGTGATTETVDDPTTQFDLQWSTTGIGPDDPNSPLHPTKQAGDTEIMSTWHSFRVYYGTYDPLYVPVDDDPTSTNGYIYTTFIKNEAFRAWEYIESSSTIADASAAGYQADYQALTNMGTGSIRLYDLEYDEDYAVVVVGVDKAGNVGNQGLQSWATNNTIRFALIQGNLIDKDIAQAAFPEAELENTNTETAAALYWIASGPTNEQGQYTAVSKDYDLISWDSLRFQENSNNQWKLVDTVRSNWFVDDGGQMIPRGHMRFYRASYKDRWRTTNYLGQAQPRLASEEIYAMHNVVLSPGPNFVAIHGNAYTNTFMGVFGGIETFPGGLSAMPDSGSTLIEFYTPGVDAVTSEQYFLSDQNEWIKVGGSTVSHVAQESNFFGRGFSITLPDPLPGAYVNTTATDENLGETLDAMVWTPILQVPTNTFTQEIKTGSRDGRITVSVYNLVGLNLPVCTHPSEMRFLESGFVNGTRSTSDQIYTIDTATKTVRNGSTIYCDESAVWRFLASDEEVPPYFFAPNDVLVIVSKNGGEGNSWTWTYNPQYFYDLPTRWMTPE